MYCRVFHDPLVSLNFEGFDPLFFLNDPQNVLFTLFNSYERGHCDPLNRNLRENPHTDKTRIYCSNQHFLFLWQLFQKVEPFPKQALLFKHFAKTLNLEESEIYPLGKG